MIWSQSWDDCTLKPPWLHAQLWCKFFRLVTKTVGKSNCVCVWWVGGGGYLRFSTNVFFWSNKKNNLENLSDGKVLYVIKGWPKNLTRANPPKKNTFGATDLYPLCYPPTSKFRQIKNVHVFQNDWKLPLNFFFDTLKLDFHGINN